MLRWSEQTMGKGAEGTIKAEAGGGQGQGGGSLHLKHRLSPNSSLESVQTGQMQESDRCTQERDIQGPLLL